MRNFILKICKLSIWILFITAVNIMGTGIEISYMPQKKLNIGMGTFWGDEKISIIQPSPFLKIEFNKFNQNIRDLSESRTGFTQSFIKIDDRIYNFTTVSGTEAGLKRINLTETGSINIGLGLTQAAIVYYCWGGAVGIEYEFSPGIEFVCNISSWVAFILGGDSQILIGPNNVQNINLYKSSFNPLTNNVWLELLLAKLIDVKIYYYYGVANDTLGIQFNKNFGKNAFLKVNTELYRSKNILFPEKGIFKIETEILTAEEGISLSLSALHERIQYIAGYPDDDNTISVNIRIPFAIGKDKKTTVNFIGSEDIKKDKYLSDKHYYTYTTEYFSFKEQIKSAIINNSYTEFNNFIKKNTDSVEKILWLASVIGDFSGRWVYDYDGLTLEGIKRDIFSDTLRNTATSEQIYQSLHDAFLTEKEKPTTVCRGIGRFVANVVNTVGLQNVSAYTSRVDVSAGGHIIVPIVTPEQVYIVDYNNIIPTMTRNISSGLQIYQNLNRTPTLRHYIWSNGGRLINKIETADTLLLNQFLTVQGNKPVNKYLENLFILQRTMNK